MGVVDNRIRIDELEKGGSGSIEQRLSHLEDEYTTLASYSNEEQLIGEWVDGSNIYRKVIDIGQLPTVADTIKYVPHNIDNLKQLISLSGTAQNNENTDFIPIPMVSTYDWGENIKVSCTSDNIVISNRWDYGRVYTGVIILTYTKNED